MHVVCDYHPISNITFQVNLEAFKKDYILSQYSQITVEILESSSSVLHAGPTTTTAINSVIYFRKGYSIGDIISFFCAVHINDCKIDKYRNLNVPHPNNANILFLEKLNEHAEGILSKIQIEEDQMKILERLKSKNYFEVLGVTPSETSEADIKVAYKTLARKYHPDKFMGNKAFATQALQYINVAYEVLSDDLKRKEHELSLSPNAGQNSNNGGVQFHHNDGQGQGFHFSFGGGGGSFSFTFNF